MMRTKSIFLLFLIAALSCTILGGVSGLIVAKSIVPIPYAETQATTEPMSTEDVPFEAQANSALSIADVAQLCTKVIVNIEVETIKKGYTGGSAYSKTELSYGTGIVIRNDGYLATCYHVVEGADKITVIMDDKTEYEAELVGYDDRFDLAVIRVDATSLDAAAVGSFQDLRAGEGVVIIGNPLGEFGSSVTAGVLSATEREVTIAGEPLRLLQTDAAVNPGNSGGGMFNMKGELIGMVNAKMSAAGIEGLAFAIPLNSIQAKVDSIINDGSTEKKAVLGISTKSSVCYSEGVEYNCVEITSVRTDSPAEKAGLMVGDFLISANGKDIKNNDDLVLIIKYSQPGDEVEFEVCRNNKKLTKTVILGNS